MSSGSEDAPVVAAYFARQPTIFSGAGGGQGSVEGRLYSTETRGELETLIPRVLNKSRASTPGR
jgi:hypothetical protein